MSWGVLESFRVLTLPAPSGMRTSEELGVGRGEPEGVLLGLGTQADSRRWSAVMGGKEGEKTEDGRFASPLAGERWQFL